MRLISQLTSDNSQGCFFTSFLGRKQSVHFLLIAVLFPIIIASSCKPKNEETNSEAASAVSKLTRPDFSSDSAFRFIEEQLAFGPRVPGTPAQQQCASYFEQKFKSYGASVVLQKTNVTVYSGKRVPCINIIASFNPEVKRRLLICAHWDSRPFADQGDSAVASPILAADDGASGVAVILEIARQLQIKDPEIGVDLILFDVEDYGQPEFELEQKQGEFYCLGSQYWSGNLHTPNYRAEHGILLDMVGAKNATFTYEGISMQYAPLFLKEVWKRAHALGYGNFFRKEVTSQIVDDHYYINTVARIPTIDIINRTYQTRTGFPEHWHTHDDNIAIIDKVTLQAVGETVLATVYEF